MGLVFDINAGNDGLEFSVMRCYGTAVVLKPLPWIILPSRGFIPKMRKRQSKPGSSLSTLEIFSLGTKRKGTYDYSKPAVATD